MRMLYNIKRGLPLMFLINSLIATSFANTGKTSTQLNDNQQWLFTVAPYGWMSSISADMTVKNTTQHVFVPFSKVLKVLDFVGEVHLEASRGPWAFMLDPTYIKLSPNITAGPIYVGPLKQTVIGPINVNIVTQTLLTDAGVFYQAYQDNSAPNRSLSIEALGGARYLGLKNQMTLAPSRSDFFPGITVSSSTGVIAPIIGGRIKQKFAKTQMWFKGDVGGFGVDHVTNTWGATAGLAYSVRPNIELAVAYRVLKIKVNKSTELTTNSLMYGPEVGLAFYF